MLVPLLSVALVVTVCLLAWTWAGERRLRTELGSQRTEVRSLQTGLADAEVATQELGALRSSLQDQLVQTEQKAHEAHALVTETEAALAEATAARSSAEERVDELTRRLAEADRRSAHATGSLDAVVLWALERERSERTWREGVATSPDEVYVPDGSSPLLQSLRVEVDAIREGVGTAVELDVEVPDDLTAAGCVLTLRVAQELLASVVHRVESAVLQVRLDGTDSIVTLRALDEHGETVLPDPLPLPASDALVTLVDGVRVREVRALNDSNSG